MNSFAARAVLRVGDREYDYFRLATLARAGFDVARLPYSLRILLESLLRREDGVVVERRDIEAVAGWAPGQPAHEIAFTPARVLLQDFTGIPALVDLAAMRDAMAALGGDPARIDPQEPVDLVIDHSMQVDVSGRADALAVNRRLDYARNHERYVFLKWGQGAFGNVRVVPPYTGICHQVNLEHLARVVVADASPEAERPLAYPDTVLGTDSHTPMVNGLGVLGWGVGGIEAEAAMLGQPVAMLIPEVVGVRLEGALAPGATATDLVLTVCELLRRTGVVGKIVEFYGPGVRSVRLADRATIGNMSPEYGATCAIFPVDEETLRYLRFTGRAEEHVALVEAYTKAQGLFHTPDAPEPRFSATLALDLAAVEPSVAGPRRPQDRVPLARAAAAFRAALPSLLPPSRPEGGAGALADGAVVIASITSCTNTSNPSVMVAAGLLAKKAAARGLRPPAWVKTSLAPGSQVVTRYLARAGLQPSLDALGFQLVGYGCATCIGNSGPLAPEIADEIRRRGLVVCSVLSGNRNFEGRIHPDVRANYLMSPPLVVAYALAGGLTTDLTREPLGVGSDGRPVFLREVWPTAEEIEAAVAASLDPEMFRAVYGDLYTGDEAWQAVPAPGGERFAWDATSTYVRRPPYFDAMPECAPEHLEDVRGARVLAMLGDSVTTDHISPAGGFAPDSPAGRYLVAHGVAPADFNSYGARRGNHEVMMRGTFANVRLRNALAPGTEGGVTTHLPSGERLTIFDAAERYRAEGVPLLVLAGKEYGSGSSRDWAAKGPALLGVRAVIAESYERIHRSNLVGMGILPLQYAPGESAATLGLTGREVFDLGGLDDAVAGPRDRAVTVTATREDGTRVRFRATARLDTPQESVYVRHGGILPYVLRQLLGGREVARAVSPGVAAAAQAGDGAAPDDGAVERASVESFPASDPPTY
jgi:aconitate hydratase